MEDDRTFKKLGLVRGLQIIGDMSLEDIEVALMRLLNSQNTELL
jgi:hypothetical protein